MRTMEIGKLNKRLTFKRFADVTDAMGQSKKILTELCTVWGSLYPVRGAEFYEVQKIQSKITHKCYVRYRENIDSSCYIEYKGKLFTIESIIDVDMQHKMLEIMCVEHIGKEVIANG